MTIEEVSQVNAFHLGKGRFSPLIVDRRMHLLQPLMSDGRVATGTAVERSLRSWFESLLHPV